MIKNFTFTTSENESIAVTTYGEPLEDKNAVIYVHGFKGFKDWGFVPYIGQFLAQSGIFAITFNFSHNGIGDNPLEFTENDKFANNTYSREIQELSEIISACNEGKFGSVKNIGLLGHSRGGGISLLTAAQNDLASAVTTWSSVSTFDRFNDELKNEWRAKGYIEVKNMRTGQIMHMNTVLLDDMEQNGNNTLNVEKAVKNIHRPLLFIHGEKDEAVPVNEADALYGWADKSLSGIIRVSDTGHTFGAKHPFEGSNDKLDYVLKSSSDFFIKTL